MSAKTCWDDLSQILGKVSRLMLYGEPGFGKSLTVEEFYTAKYGEDSVATIHVDRSTQPDVLYGTPAVRSDGRGGTNMVWQDGAATRIVRRSAAGMPGALIFDDIHNIGDDLSGGMLAFANYGRTRITLPNETCETLTSRDWDSEGQPLYTVVVTLNGEPQDFFTPEFIDRFPTQIKIDCVNPAAVAAFPADWQDMVRATVSIPDASRRIGIRKWREFLSQVKLGVPLDVATRVNFGAQAQAAHDAIKAANIDVAAVPALANKRTRPVPTVSTVTATAAAAVVQSSPVPVAPIATAPATATAQSNRKVATCVNCGSIKVIVAKGLCRSCYDANRSR